MVLGSLQSFLTGGITLLAGLAGLLGLFFVNRLFKEKIKSVEGANPFIFILLAFGYISLAAGELTRFLIIDIFQKDPTVSMPDFYWVFGIICLLVAFTLYSIYLHQNHGNTAKSLTLMLATIIILGGVFLYFYSFNFFSEGSTFGEQFINYFYPLATALTLLASFNVFLFLEKAGTFTKGLLFFVVANASTLLGDLLFSYFKYAHYAEKGLYGLIGLTMDSAYLIGYGLYALAFLYLLLNLKEVKKIEE
jgi:hypothetical protein